MDWSANVLSFLASVTLRSLCLVALALTMMLAFRVRTAAARHAVLTMTMLGTLLLTALAPLVPSIPIRVLRPAPDVLDVAIPFMPASELAVSPPVAINSAEKPGDALPSWQQWLTWAYLLGVLALLARLVFSYLFTLRLVRASRPVNLPWAGGIHESAWLSVPITVGCLRAKVLLPLDWETWEPAKLQAVLAHERTHIARADWTISILAGLNRCLFWFNPVAWWLERRLASLAEEACDDAALLEVQSEHYAQALLDMAAAVKTGQGRLIWEAMAMAKAAEVRKRIERILDETRQIPRAVTRARWAALVACSLPLIYLAAVVQLAAQETPKTPAAMAEFLKGKRQFTPADVTAMEQYLAANAHDLDVRSQLVVHYFTSGSRERINHIFWLITNHPEANQTAFASTGISPRPNELNNAADYASAAALWRQQVALRPDDSRVLNNAAQFFSQPGGDFDEAERLLLKVRSQSFNLVPDRLAKLYASAILGATGDSRFVNSNPKLADRVKAEFETSSDAVLLHTTGIALTSVARRPTGAAPLPPGTLNLDDHPMLVPAIDFGQRLLARAKELGMQTGPTTPASQEWAAWRRSAEGSPAPAAAAPTLPEAPTPVSKVDPLYPALARQARIQGDVRLSVIYGSDGRVTNMEVVSGHPLMVPQALEAVKQWVFPAAGSGTKYRVTVPFRLDGANAPPAAGGVGGVVGSIPGGVLPGVVGGIAQPGQPRVPGPGEPMPQRIRVGGNVQAARLTNKVDPAYPALARQARIEGVVSLEVTIGPEGRVESVTPISGHPLLAAAAMDAVKQWVYSKTSLGATPVTVITQVTVPFELNQ